MALEEQDRKQIVALAVKIIAGMIEKGEVDPNDKEGLRCAAQDATVIAKETYLAALDFLGK